MSNFFVDSYRMGEGVQPHHELHEDITAHYCQNDHRKTTDVLDFIGSFNRMDYIVHGQGGRIAGYFSLTVADDMHLGRIASYVTLFVIEEYRGNRELAKLINWHSMRFAQTFNCKYISKVKHVSPLKRIESFKEVTNVKH